jgi:hypothetical protein
MMAGRMVTHKLLGRVRNAGLNLQQVAVAACGEHCDEIIRKMEAAPTAGFRAKARFPHFQNASLRCSTFIRKFLLRDA